MHNPVRKNPKNNFFFQNNRERGREWADCFPPIESSMTHDLIATLLSVLTSHTHSSLTFSFPLFLGYTAEYKKQHLYFWVAVAEFVQLQTATGLGFYAVFLLEAKSLTCAAANNFCFPFYLCLS